jgi:hypothetical protein
MYSRDSFVTEWNVRAKYLDQMTFHVSRKCPILTGNEYDRSRLQSFIGAAFRALKLGRKSELQTTAIVCRLS